MSHSTFVPAGGRPERGRQRGLRRQWRTSFLVMAAVLGLALAAMGVAYVQVVNHYKLAASRVQHALALSARLGDALTEHEGLAHVLWGGQPADRALYLRQQDQIAALFAEGLRDLRSEQEQALLASASQAWQQAFTSRGLWAPALAPPPSTFEKQRVFAVASDQVADTVRHLTSAGISEGQHDLEVADGLQRAVLALLGAVFALVLAVALYFARRVRVDVIRPLERLHQAATSLEAGDLAHRVEVAGPARHNEFGVLAEAFNAMTCALDESHRSLSRQANHDPLTGLPNRTAFERQLAACFAPTDRPHTGTVSVLFIDIDDFKVVNDSFGHAGGDLLLGGVAERLTAAVRPGDLVARLGGDEFAILLNDRTPVPDAAEHVAERIHQALCEPFRLDGREVLVSASVGSSAVRPGTQDARQVVAEADYAMYTAKREGKGQHQVFDGPDGAPHTVLAGGATGRPGQPEAG